MDDTVKNKLEGERFKIRLLRRNLQRQLTRSTLSEDEQLALQLRGGGLAKEEQHFRPADGIHHRPSRG